MKEEISKTGLLVSLFFPILMAAVLTACSGAGKEHNETGQAPAPPSPPGVSQAVNIPSANVMPTIFQVAKGLALQLRRNLREEDLQAWPCIVTSLADINNLSSSSRFGRLLAEAVSSQLFRQGGVIRDVRSARALFVQPRNGELILSRNAGNLAREMDTRAVIAGTYGRGASSVAVNIRMIDLSTRAVISVAMTEIALTPAIAVLLEKEHGKEKVQAPVPTSYDVQVF